MPRSFLVKMKQSTTVSKDRTNDTSNHTYPPLESVGRDFNARTFDREQLLRRYSEVQVRQRQTPIRTNGSNFGAEFVRYEPPVNTYLSVHNPQHQLPSFHSHPQSSSEILLTAHPPLVTSYPSWPSFGWLTTDGNLLYPPSPTPPHYPQMIRARRPTWGHPAVSRYSTNVQRRWSTGQPTSQVQLGQLWSLEKKRKATEAPECTIEIPGKRQTEGRGLGEVREEWKSLPVIKEFFSLEKVHDSKFSEDKMRLMEEPRDGKKLLAQSSKDDEELPHEISEKNEDEMNQSSNSENMEEDSAWTSESAMAPPARSAQNDIGANIFDSLLSPSQEHDPQKPYICKECGKEYRQQGRLNRHLITHVTEKSYVCTQCNKSFNRASNLHTHIKTHSDYKPYKCDYCGKGFHQKIDKRIHQYTHTGEKPYKCQKCGRSFKQLTHLNYHMRTHSDQRMYHCTYCNKGFNQKGNLKAHIYGHTGERPFKCDTCGKGFTLRSTLNTHMRTHAPNKPFACEYCDKAFYQKNALKMHHIASHPIVNGKSIL